MCITSNVDASLAHTDVWLNLAEEIESRFGILDLKFEIDIGSCLERDRDRAFHCLVARMGAVLWLQIAYLLWQFVRGEKYCRVPYAVAVHTFMWVIGKWSRPFAWRNYLVLGTGRTKFYVFGSGAETIQKSSVSRTDRFHVEVSHPEGAPGMIVISIPAVNYKLCIPENRKNESFVWNYLRDQPECVARVADVLVPNLSVIDRIDDEEGLRMMCQGDYIPQNVSGRFLAMPDREHELNQSFIRLLSSVPLMAQAMGHPTLSLWISVGVIVVDQLSLLFNWTWRRFQRLMYYMVTAPVAGSFFQPRTGEMLCALLSTISNKFECGDQVRRKFIKLRKGSVVYTMYPGFNLADFERITVREFTRKRKTLRPYSKEKFGTFTSVGDEMEVADGTPVLTHYIDGSRIDSIFKDNGTFLNFRNNEAIHLGCWKSESKDPKDSEETDESADVIPDPKDSKDDAEASDGARKDSANSADSADPADNFNNFQDLLQVMEEMQMLPLRQTDKGEFRSVDFNMFVCPGRTLKDLTFLIAKKTVIIGG